MSDETPNETNPPNPPGQPNQRPMPWEPQPPESASADPTVVWSSPQATPAPAPPLVPGSSPSTPTPPAPGGLISSAPVGWAAPQPAPEVAPGLSFAGIGPRLVSYIIDSIIVGIAGGLISSVLGFGSTGTAVGTGGPPTTPTSIDATFIVPSIVIGLVYFVFFWSGGRRATPGQRVFDLQVGNAFDGQALSVTQAVKRWLGLGSVIGLVGLIPDGYLIGTFAQFVWVIVLLITTAMSSTNQGLHDRFANSAVVRPSAHGSSGLVAACLIVLLLLAAFAVFAIVALIVVGSQLSEILSEVGTSI